MKFTTKENYRNFSTSYEIKGNLIKHLRRHKEKSWKTNENPQKIINVKKCTTNITKRIFQLPDLGLVLIPMSLYILLKKIEVIELFDRKFLFFNKTMLIYFTSKINLIRFICEKWKKMSRHSMTLSGIFFYLKIFSWLKF